MSTSKDYVQRYLWHDYGQQFHSTGQLTLTGNEALAFLAFISVLVAYTQTRAWKLACLAVKRVTRPIQLSDENEPDSLSHLTQREAILHSVATLSLWFKGDQGHVFSQALRHREMKSISPLFGVIAVGNLVIFLALGVLVPWALTGGLNPPLVQSRTWDGCYRHDGSSDLTGKGEKEAYLAADKYQRCWFNTSGILDSCPWQDNILLDRPVLHVSRNISCPFAEPACFPKVRPLQLDHINLTLRDYGVNLNSKLLYSRRLTCAPLTPEHFIAVESNGEAWLLFAKTNSSLMESGTSPLDHPLSWFGEDGSRMTESGDSPRLRLRLSFPDGRMPHPTDPDSSFWFHDTAPNLKYWVSVSGGIRTLHPDLDRLRGETFVIAFHAGRLRSLQPIDDPIYYSHFKNGAWSYLPDYEYTAMGCVEQHQICLSVSSIGCTQYTSFFESRREIADRVTPLTEETTAKELKAFEEVFWPSNSFNFVDARGIGALLASQPNILNWRDIHIDPNEQWTWDVKAWFESSFLLFRVHLFAIITGDRVGSFFTTEEKRDNICGHALFLDGDYTNINFLGLVISLFAIAIISGCSHLPDLKRFARYISKFSWLDFRLFWTRGTRFCMKFGSFPILANKTLGTSLATLPR